GGAEDVRLPDHGWHLRQSCVPLTPVWLAGGGGGRAGAPPGGRSGRGRSPGDRLDLRGDRVRQPCHQGRSPCPGRTRTAYRHLHDRAQGGDRDRKSTRLNSSHVKISYAVFCLKKKKNDKTDY